jgi:hypothetical protein
MLYAPEVRFDDYQSMVQPRCVYLVASFGCQAQELVQEYLYCLQVGHWVF